MLRLGVLGKGPIFALTLVVGYLYSLVVDWYPEAA